MGAEVEGLLRGALWAHPHGSQRDGQGHRKPNAALEKLSRVPARIPKWWGETKEPT
jgi:hypothetical protein